MISDRRAQAALFQLTGVGVVETDLTTGRFLRVNETFCEMVGYSEAELQALTYLELTHPNDRERDSGTFAALQRGELKEGASLTRVRHKNDSVRWLELHVTLVEESDTVTNLAVVNDVTERHRAEEALRESEERYRTLFNAVDEGFYLAEVVWDEAGRAVDVRYHDENPAAVRLVGQAAKGRLLSDLDPNYEPHWRDTFGHTARTGEAQRLELYAAPNGVWFDFYVFKPEGVADDRTVAVIFRDGTERKRREANLAFLAELSLDLERLISVDDTMNALGAKIVAHLGLSACVFAELFGENEAQTAELTHGWHRAGTPSLLGTYRMSEFMTLEMIQMCRAEKSIVIRDVFADPKTDGERYAALNIGSFIGVPLVRDGEWRFLLVVYRSEPHDWQEDEIALVRELTARIWTRLERARAEEALHKSEARLRDLNRTLEQRVAERTEKLEQSERRFSRAFFANPIPACMTTRGVETFVEVNDAFSRLTGYARDEVVGRTVFELGMWSSRNDQRKLEDALADGRGFFELELHLRDKRGRAHDVLLSAEPVPLDGREGFLKMFYDVTERKEGEALVHRAISEVMSDTSWFSQKVLERLANIRAGKAEGLKTVDLTRRERAVLERLAQGLNNDAIAAELGVATQTIRNYISVVYDKLGVHTRGEAIVWARERGITGGRPER